MTYYIKGGLIFVSLLECYCKVEGYGRITVPAPYRKEIEDRKVVLIRPEERYVAGYLLEKAEHWTLSKDKAKTTAADIMEIELD